MRCASAARRGRVGASCDRCRAAGTSTSSDPGTKRRAAKEGRRAANSGSRSSSKAIFGTPTRCWKPKTHWQYAHSSLQRPSSLSTNRFVFLVALRACVLAVVIDHGSPAATRAARIPAARTKLCVAWCVRVQVDSLLATLPEDEGEEEAQTAMLQELARDNDLAGLSSLSHRALVCCAHFAPYLHVSLATLCVGYVCASRLQICAWRGGSAGREGRHGLSACAPCNSNLQRHFPAGVVVNCLHRAWSA